MEQSEGIVLRCATGAYDVQVGDEVLTCRLRGNLKKELVYSTSGSRPQRVNRTRRLTARKAVVVGDRVRVSFTGNREGVIEEVLPRSSSFSRLGFRGQAHTIVSNIDLLVIVFACAEPRPDLWKLDRFLVTAHLSGLEALVVANKVDLVGEDGARAAFGEHLDAGYSVVLASARTLDGVEQLRVRLAGRVSAFVGPSGAGKSSLLNALDPNLRRATQAIGGVTFKGRHTTVAAELLPFAFGGWVADTPGLRQLDLPPADRSEVRDAFPELRALDRTCRFDDCRHDSEPGCAVKELVECGRLSERRYRSFLTLAEEAHARLSAASQAQK